MVLQKTMYPIPIDKDRLQVLLHSVIKDDDLVRETLLLMPITSLKELKFVCRRWHSLISNPSFIAARSKRIERASGLFLKNYMLATNFVSFNQEKKPTKSICKRLKLGNEQMVVYNSCNGLVCCHGRSFLVNPAMPCAYIYNPTTNRYGTIPNPVYYEEIDRSCISSMSVAFDPTRSASYKVICLYIARITYESTDDYDIGVYSSDTKLWNHAVGPFKLSMPSTRNGVYWNGAIFWITEGNDSFYFKIEDCERHSLTMPAMHEHEAEGNILYFGESRGHLHLAYTNGGPRTQFIIYEMGEDFCGWLAKYSIDLEAVMDAFPGSIQKAEPRDSPYRYYYGLVYIYRDENQQNNFVLLRIWGNVIRYDIRQKTFHKICDLVPVTCVRASAGTEWGNTLPFIESLAPV